MAGQGPGQGAASCLCQPSTTCVPAKARGRDGEDRGATSPEAAAATTGPTARAPPEHLSFPESGFWGSPRAVCPFWEGMGVGAQQVGYGEDERGMLSCVRNSWAQMCHHG